MRQLAIGALAAALLGCASATLEVTEPVKPIAREVTLSLSALPGAPMSEAEQSALRSRLAARLEEGGVKVVTAPGPRSSIAQGRIADWEPGDRLLRLFVPFAAGQGSFDSTWLVKDEGGGAIGQCRIHGRVPWGGFRGGYDDLLDESGRLLAACLLNQPPR